MQNTAIVQDQQADRAATPSKKPASPVSVARRLPAVRTAVRAGDLYLHNPGRR